MIGNPQASPIEQLNNQARPRPDLITPGSTGSLENAKPVVYMGRVATQPTSVQEMLSKVPVGELESGGQALEQLPKGLLVAGMAKQFKPGISKLAALARPGKTPGVELEKMFPALIDTNSGEVVHAMSATGAGGHRSLYDAVSGLKNFSPTRGFVDPSTFDAYTESMLEEALQKKALSSSVPSVARVIPKAVTPDEIMQPVAQGASKFAKLNNEIASLEESILKKGASPETLWGLKQQASNTLDLARQQGARLPVDAHAQIYAEGLRRLLATEVK